MPYRVDIDQFVEETLSSVADLPDALVEALKERMSLGDSARKNDLQKLLSEAGDGE